jgi:hypothetical protein
LRLAGASIDYLSMPRIEISGSIHLRYKSPHEMVEHLEPVLAAGVLTVPASPDLTAGMEIPIVVHLPWLGREIDLWGALQSVDAADASLRLLSTTSLQLSALQEVRNVVSRVRAGAILESARGSGQSEQAIKALDPMLRAMLALKATAEERSWLLKDAHPRVVESLLKNPAIGLDEVRVLAGRNVLHQGHFNSIVAHKVWMADEQVRATLARNPRLPEYLAETVLQLQSTGFLKTLAEGINCTASTRRAAIKVLKSRGVKVKTVQAGGESS